MVIRNRCVAKVRIKRPRTSSKFQLSGGGDDAQCLRRLARDLFRVRRQISGPVPSGHTSYRNLPSNSGREKGLLRLIGKVCMCSGIVKYMFREIEKKAEEGEAAAAIWNRSSSSSSSAREPPRIEDIIPHWWCLIINFCHQVTAIQVRELLLLLVCVLERNTRLGGSRPTYFVVGHAPLKSPPLTTRWRWGRTL